jgi:hypothetical protein
MTTKCPKCGSEDTLHYAATHYFMEDFDGGYRRCRKCDTPWTDWQQALIEKQQVSIETLKYQYKVECDTTNRLIDRNNELEAEIDRLRAVLTSIAEHVDAREGISESIIKRWPDRYEIGLVKGHRCAAEIARKGLDEKNS